MLNVLGVFATYVIEYLVLLACERLLRSPVPVETRPNWWPQVVFLIVLGNLATAGFFTAINHVQFYAAVSPLWQFWAGLPYWVGLSCAVFYYTFCQYWLHRAQHASEFLWRACHQMHHAPSRFDLSSADYQHPLSPVVTLASHFFLFVAAGFSLPQFLIAATTHGVLNKVQHLHIRTPRWFGYFLYRPEDHRLHHSSVNTNFGLIPLWDWIFGTYRECSAQVEAVGFPEEGQAQFWKIFFFRRVS